MTLQLSIHSVDGETYYDLTSPHPEAIYDFLMLNDHQGARIYLIEADSDPGDCTEYEGEGVYKRLEELRAERNPALRNSAV